MPRALAVIAAVLAAAYGATVAHAQDASARATAGSIALREGFLPDPVEVDIYSGGGIDASRLGGACVGMIAEAPDFELTYTAGRSPLSLAVVSEGDTSLVVNGPDGRWYCVDDSDGLDPILTWSRPGSGVYDIWVGAVGEGASSTLLITESQ